MTAPPTTHQPVLPPLDKCLAQARVLARSSGERVTVALQQVSGMEGDQFVEALARMLGYSWLTMDELRSLEAAFDLLPYAEALRRHCLLLHRPDGHVLAFSDPFDTDLLQWMHGALPADVSQVLVHDDDLSAYLALHENSLRAMDSTATDHPSPQTADARVEHLSLAGISEDASPVVRLVHSTIYDALKAGASDIHLESEPSGLVVRYRIDGVLNHISSVGSSVPAEQVMSRIKVMAELDIAERRVPQDGRFRVAVSDREVDLRVSIMPSAFGEDAVLRVLDRSSITSHLQSLRLRDLGFDEVTLSEMHRLFNEPYGMVLVTGPTGSGKTTTLYAAISEINNGRDKIVTIEDPVEYQLGGVLQIPVNEKKGLTFARGLRSILRHDPDKIMVGEIRDAETANIAVQSALTGHLVLTTVHANNVFDVIGRFANMDVDPYSLVSALNGVLAQRLIRVVCTHCAEPVTLDPAALQAARIAPERAAVGTFMQGRGCGHCRGSGYRGRKAISELLNLNDEIRERIVAREPIRRIKEAARRAGTRYLRESAEDMLLRGETTLEEINRVTFVE